ncbi:MAG: efflux RND transporter periplasmic adaptor subunit [Deltaproteobacteria bacterium]|nr:efflux RND transporter periplasmic adaptor subunit [Deltaproteobacteria bacterium]
MNSSLRPAILAAAWTVFACQCPPGEQRTPPAEGRALASLAGGSAMGEQQRRDGHAHENEDNHGHEGHGGEKELSDMDRPVDELFSATCEHGRKTFECDECRYEIGVVKAPGGLFDGALLKKAAVGQRRVEAPIVLTGEIKFDERRVAHISAQTEGVVRKVHLSLGDRVKKGQPLVEIESVSFGQAESEHLEAQATLELARRSHDRQAELRQENITSEKEYLQAKRELEAAQIRARTAGDKLVQLGLPPSELKGLGQSGARARLVLRAPADGMVLVLHAVPGEVAKSEEPLLTVGDLSTLWLWADLYERDLALVADHQSAGGLQALVTVKAFPGEEFPGSVDFVGPTMEEATRTVKVRIGLKNPAGRLRAGMFANVRIFLPGKEEVLALPKDAVLEDEGRSFVFVHHHDDYFVRRPVKRGRAWAGWVEVTSGLAGGEMVVSEGSFLLKSDVLRSKMGAGCAD